MDLLKAVFKGLFAANGSNLVQTEDLSEREEVSPGA